MGRKPRFITFSTHAPPIPRATRHSRAYAMSSVRYPLTCHQDPNVSPCRATAAACSCIAVESQSGFARDFTDPEVLQFCNATLDDSSGLSWGLEPDFRGYSVGRPR